MESIDHEDLTREITFNPHPLPHYITHSQTSNHEGHLTEVYRQPPFVFLKDYSDTNNPARLTVFFAATTTQSNLSLLTVRAGVHDNGHGHKRTFCRIEIPPKGTEPINKVVHFTVAIPKRFLNDQRLVSTVIVEVNGTNEKVVGKKVIYADIDSAPFIDQLFKYQGDKANQSSP